MARPENSSEARSLSLTLQEETFNYLVLLATMGKLGRTQNEVAPPILGREPYAMQGGGFAQPRIPPAGPGGRGGGAAYFGLKSGHASLSATAVRAPIIPSGTRFRDI